MKIENNKIVGSSHSGKTNEIIKLSNECENPLFMKVEEETKTLKSRGLKTDNIIDCEIGQFETFEDLMKFVNSKRTNEQVFIDDIQTMISESVSTKSLKKIPTFITYTFRILK